MSSSSGKGFWVAAAILASFGLARVLTLDASVREDILGKRAPDFQLEAVNGDRVKLSELDGKVVVLDFWAVWCGPCQDSMPFFQTLQNKYGKHGLEVLGLHVNDRMPPPDRVQAYLDEHKVRYRNLVSTTAVDDEFMVYAMPTTYLLDRDGIVKKRHVGFNPATTPEKLEEDVRTLLDLN